ncbi:helix-turn-helix transcriptional regulator [Steroidobacter cummioxidans]|uniref:helix-turn-helix transcriptional regulator n=1 Tax=Steroidobacter cummioxidans TaxID=1803913 RepID=UPI00137B80C2|nr:response regulator transcription factor [Steroidobacter cummioxidans]
MPLLVGVLATDETRRAALTKLVADAGHRVVASAQSDVIVSDAKQTSPSRPTLVFRNEGSPAENHLPWDAPPRQVDAALRALVAGLSIRPARSAPRRGFEELDDSAVQSVLTPRELDVIDAIGAGLSNKAIARELGISLHTVKFHIESLLRKLGAHTRAEAVAKAMERRRQETVEL